MPGHLTVTLVHDVPRRAGGAARAALGRGRGLGRPDGGVPAADRSARCRAWISPASSALTRDLGIGDTTMVRDDGDLLGFALWHSTPLAAGRPKDELRVLKVVAAKLRIASSAWSSWSSFGRRPSG